MNIIDYCKKYSDISFKEDPFNYVDNLCFCQMMYTPFDDVLKQNEVITVGELWYRFLNSGKYESTLKSKSLIAEAPLVLEAMAKTDRFKKCKVYNFVSILHKQSTEQFAAIMIELSNKENIVCFRGTDDSLVGWHEDLLMSYTLMPSQTAALNYVNKYCRPLKKYRIIGHSKGGNLAIYAAINCKYFVQKRIVQVISNDGPGLRRDTYSQRAFKRISNRYFKIVPEYDVFGTIYDNCENKLVIKSDQKDIMQHSAMSWQTIGNKFKLAKDINNISKLYKQAFDKFMDETSINQRSEMIREVFRYLDEANINNISDFSIGGIPVIIRALKSMNGLRPEARDTILKLIKVIAQAHADNATEKLNNELELVKGRAKVLASNIKKKKK